MKNRIITSIFTGTKLFFLYLIKISTIIYKDKLNYVN